MIKQTTYCGFVYIVGRPNVGKSTLLNKLLGRKISITSRKPQTTRHCIIGIKTTGQYQAIYVDTPGIHVQEKRVIDYLINSDSSSYIGNVELVIFVVKGTQWTKDEVFITNKLRNINCPVVLAINKIDKIADKRELLPHMNFISKQISFYDVVPICAENGMNIEILTNIVFKNLPKATHHFPENCITNNSQKFIISEIIREKLIRFFGDEISYSVKVEIDSFVTNNRGGYNIDGIILVEREGQKKIIIGNKGSKIKTIGIEARKDIEFMFNTWVYLKLWVKIKSGCNDNKHIFHSLKQNNY